MGLERILDLPPELVLVCLSHLSLDDIRACLKAGNRTLTEIIVGSVEIQYRFEQARAGVQGNPYRSPMPAISTRLQDLREREANWLNFTPSSRTRVHFRFQPTGIYDLASDIYSLFDDPDGTVHTKIKYTSLKYTTGFPGSHWKYIDVGKPVVDSGTALAEHDLIAIATRTPCTEDGEFVELEIMLLEFSTGEPHPLATRPTIYIHTIELDRGEPFMVVDILGNNLVICVLYLSDEPDEMNELHLYNWRTGIWLLSIPVDNIGFTFLTPDILVVPSCIDAWLEVFRITRSAEEADLGYTHLGRFGLPRLAEGRILVSIQCSGKPHPHSGVSRPSHARFVRDAGDSVVLFSCEIHDEITDNHRHETLVVSRPLLHALLPETGTTYPSASSVVPWEEWGPRCARWLDCTRWATRYPMSSCGARVVAIGAHATQAPTPIQILDFNPVHVRSGEQRFQETTDSARTVVGGADEEGYAAPCFAARVHSELPYLEITSKEVFEYGAVLINNEDIIGVTFGEDAYVRALEFLHFG